MRREIHLSAAKRHSNVYACFDKPGNQEPEIYAVKAQLDIGDPQRFPNVEIVPRADISNMAQQFCANLRQVVSFAGVMQSRIPYGSTYFKALVSCALSSLSAPVQAFRNVERTIQASLARPRGHACRSSCCSEGLWSQQPCNIEAPRR